jgi:glycosyltransferase involved in cell wall biosynthesis
MHPSARYLAVIPAYNEAATVGDVICDIRSHQPRFDIVVVDDGSTDATGEIAGDVLRMPFNVGIGGAVQAGFLYALEQGYDYALQVDADGQHRADQIEDLIAAIDANPALDVVCGSRFLSEDHGYPAPVSRRTGIHVFAFLLSVIIRQRVSDPTSGFRLYNRRAIELFARDYPHDYPEVEAVVLLHFHRFRMAEVPVSMRRRGTGRSSIGSGKSVYYMVKVLLAIFIGLARQRPTPDPGDEAPVAAAHNI